MKINLHELKKDMELNRRDRLKFIELTVEWMKRTPNRVWSKQQAEFINSVLRTSSMDKDLYMESKKRIRSFQSSREQ